MEGDSYPPPSEMEVGNVAPEAMPVKSLVGDYSNDAADVSHHQDHQDHHGGERRDEMDHQETPSFSNGNGNGGADEEQSKDDDDAPPKEAEQKPDPFDVFGKMLSSMPAKPADEEEEKEAKNEDADEKNEDGDEKNEDGDEKKDTFDKMFDSEKPSDENADDEKKDTFEKMFESDKPSEESEEKKDDQEEDTKPDALEKFKANEFGEENISEAFKTLEVYQKALETERSRVKKTIEEGMSPDTAVSITRKLRKLYAVTQKNMDLLDRAIVESFVENFPTESTRIHMGRVAPAQPQYAAPARSRGGASKSRKNIKQKLKVKPKGKGRKAPAKGKGKGKKGTIEINGAPDYVEYDLPASAKKKRKGYAPDSDVELVDVSEDDEYYNPKKRSRPGPASSKKGKPGPASKKKSSYY